MDKLTTLVGKEIKTQFKSVRQFSFHTGIPQSTIISALRKGIGGTSFETVIKICRTLGITPVLCEASDFLTEGERRLVSVYSHLDDLGKHTVNSVLELESRRCGENPDL